MWIHPTIRRIKTVDLITLIETVNLIKTISEITNVKNVESVDLIDLITTISEITNIKNIESIDLIDEITTIKDIESIEFNPLRNPLENKGFERGNLTGWVIIQATVVYDSESEYGSYSAKFSDGAKLRQVLNQPIPTESINEFSIRCKGSSAGGSVRIRRYYTDGTVDSDLESVGGSWETITISLSSGKKLRVIQFEWDEGGVSGCKLYLDEVDMSLQTVVYQSNDNPLDVKLYAWDGSAWKKVRCDADGYLLTKAG